MVTEVNGHRGKRCSEIITQKWAKGLNNNIRQTKCHGKYYLCLFCHLVFVILFTLHLKTLKTVYLYDRLSYL